MTQPWESTVRRTDLPVAEADLDADLARTLKHAAYMRRGFYVVVLLVALAGQVSGAVEALHIPLLAALPAVGALELGGIVVMANADVRRRLGERAVASRLLSVAIAAWAVAFNWLAHANHLLGGFFAGMSALGYLVWLMHTENQRRDRLRAKGDLPPTTPAYEMVGHWLRHPWVTRRARSLAKAEPGLGLYESLATARAEIRRERRQSAIAKVLHRKIRAAVDPTTADIAVAVYDLDEIAERLADGADYEGLTALIAADLAPAVIAAGTPQPNGRRGRRGDGPVAPAVRATFDEVGDTVRALEGARLTPTIERPVIGAGPATPAGTDPVTAEVPESVSPDAKRAAAAGRELAEQVAEWASRARPETGAVSAPNDNPAPAESRRAEPLVTARAATMPERPVSPAPVLGAVAAQLEPEPVPAGTPGREGSLRSRVYATLDAHVPADDGRDNAALIVQMADQLRLTAAEKTTAATYVRAWRRDVQAGLRAPVAGRRLRSVPPRQR